MTADEQFELRASQINDLRILKFADLVRGFYRDTLSCPYWKFDPTKKGSRTCAQRTIQRCEDEHWDLEDFLRVQFECYKKMGRRPYLQQLYSSEALCRYHDWMRENGYTVEVEDERIALDPETRKQDLAIERRAKEETRLLAQAGLLREQFDRYLEPHLARFRAALEVKYAKRVFTHEELGLPVWFGMSEEKLRASAISTEVALERLRIERNWSARRSERARVMEMIRIEIETEKRSPTIPLNLDMRKLGIPEWLIEQHEKVCSGGGKRS